MIARYYFLFGSPSFYLFLQLVQKRARSYHTPQWELHSDFHPQQVLPNHQQWVSSDGDILTAQGVTAYNTHISPDEIFDVISGKAIGDLSNLAFRDPNSFQAGCLHQNIKAWEEIFSDCRSFKQAVEVLQWIRDKVDVFQYFQRFKGSYKGVQYDSDIPPKTIFYNHETCKPFVDFISSTILERLASGAISFWGKVNEVDPPHLVLPLTVEPQKPRLCNDDRFLNLWMMDKPFQLDNLLMLTRYVTPHSFQTVCDDKSGYDHILLSERSRTFFGFQWAGCFFVSNTIPFGWKLSAYAYHSTGFLASHHFRSIGIPCSLYIDDRHTGQLMLQKTQRSQGMSFCLSRIATVNWHDLRFFWRFLV